MAADRFQRLCWEVRDIFSPHAVGIFAFRMVVKRSVLERAGIPLMEIGQFEKHRLQDALSKRFETLLGRVTAGG